MGGLTFSSRFLFSFLLVLPPKSGLNRMSYPFISLSTVSFTRGILLGSFISLTLGRERKRWWCNAEELINITRQSRFFFLFFFFDRDDMTQRGFHDAALVLVLPLAPDAGDQ